MERAQQGPEFWIVFRKKIAKLAADGLQHCSCSTSASLWRELRLRGLSNWGGYSSPLPAALISLIRTCRYGTPFLLSLGLSEQLTSLVWLAGPISGLVAQPLIGASNVYCILCILTFPVCTGAISDSSGSRYRRRYWIITSTLLLCISTLVLAYCKEIAAFFVDLFGGGLGDWDPKRKAQVRASQS